MPSRAREEDREKSTMEEARLEEEGEVAMVTEAEEGEQGAREILQGMGEIRKGQTQLTQP